MNRGAVNRGAVNRGAVNRGAVNRGAVNRGAAEGRGDRGTAAPSAEAQRVKALRDGRGPGTTTRRPRGLPRPRPLPDLTPDRPAPTLP
ncbi:hypothetical protein [Streptomyces stelliscabiei]|uniref:hypothetical protein n=1 Tax=Streptomyces stelliscabiei TaxID=146820 RepID=UPI0038D3F281